MNLLCDLPFFYTFAFVIALLPRVTIPSRYTSFKMQHTGVEIQIQ